MTDPDSQHDLKTREKLTLVDEPRSYREFTFHVLRATCKLFYLLEGAQHVATLHPDIWALRPSTPTFAAKSRMLVRLEYQRSTSDHPGVEYGPDGPFAQLAYVGWVAEIDGAWERFRTSKPFGDPGDLSRHGIEMDLMAEFHAIRNDLLKHGAVAQARTARCKELRWFPEEGQVMHLRPHHVMEFLHKLGVWYGHDMVRLESTEFVRWRCIELLASTAVAIISHRAEIEEQDGQWLLLLSVVFGDGVCGCYAIETAATREELQQRRDDLAAARPESAGLRLPSGEMLDMLDFYVQALEDLKADKVNHLWSPPMRFRS